MYLPVFPCSGRHIRLHLPVIYSGSLGLHHFPTYSVTVFSPRPSVLRSAKTASVHLGSVRFRSLPDTLLPPSFVFHRFRWLDDEQVRLVRRQVSCYAGTPFLPAGRVQGDSRFSQVRELPLYAHAPVYDPGGVPPARHLRFQDCCLPHSPPCRLSSLSRIILGPPSVIISGFNVAACTLASPLLRTPPLGDRTSVLLLACWLCFGLAGFSPAGQHQQISIPIGISQCFTLILARG